MRLAFVLASFLAIGVCSPGSPSGPTPRNPSSESPQSCYAAQLPPLGSAPSAKPDGKRKPQPPKPDALPTYELAAAIQLVGGALHVDVLR